MLHVTDAIAIEDWELTEQFVRSGGPGGQNVNKVSTAVELRFEAERSPNLPEAVKRRLRRLAGRRWTTDGAIVIQVSQSRSQARNREIARERLVGLVARAAEAPKPRVATRPTLASRRRRLEAKRKRGRSRRCAGPRMTRSGGPGRLRHERVTVAGLAVEVERSRRRRWILTLWGALMAALLAMALPARAETPAMAAVGKLTIGRNARCSGTLIAPDMVLTAGHCVLRDDRSGPVPAARIVFRTGAYPGYHSVDFAASDVVVHPLFMGTETEDLARIPHDAALVRLRQPVPADVAEPVEVVGTHNLEEPTYLASYRGGQGERARERRCPILREWEEVVALSCDVRPGESGSPILVSRDGRLGLLAIVSASSRTMRTEAAIAARADRLVTAMRAFMGVPRDP